MRKIAALLAVVLLVALALSALAEGAKAKTVDRIMYVNKDSLKVYAKKSKDAKTVKTLKGGAKVTIEDEYDNWFGIYYNDKKGNEKVGYVQSKYLTDKLPQKYCKHSWPDWTTTRSATCAQKGERSRTCPKCGKVETEELKKLAHTYGDWVVQKETTCAGPGLKTRTCTACGHVNEQEIEQLPHHYGRWVVRQEATCTEEGERWRECDVCGYVQEEAIELEPHEYGSWRILAEPSCTEEGERVRRCVVCGYRDAQVLNKLPHEFGKWTVTRQTSCTAPGEQVHTCAICGARETEAIEKLPHAFGQWRVTREPTCAAQGSRARTCSMCGTEQTEALAMLPHDYRWTVTTEATDHSAGVRSSKCTQCGAVQKTESFDPEGTIRKGARGDSVRELQQLLADQGYLTAGGVDGAYGGGTERALMRFQEDQGLTADGVAWPQTIKRLRHDFGEWRTVLALSRTQDGEFARTCKDCGYEEHRTVKAGAAIPRGKRGEDVRVVQRMLNELGFNCGTADGAYGPKLDAAFEAFAAVNSLAHTSGSVSPEDMDALVEHWLAALPASQRMGAGGNGSAVRLVLTVTKLESVGDATTYEWKLTNMGTERCRVDALLLGFGEGYDFMRGGMVMDMGGALLQRDGSNSATGTFSVSANWGAGARSFCAVGTSEKTNGTWLSNVRAGD